MRTDLTLVLALAARGNAFLRGANGRMEVLAGHPSFARFHDLAFVRQTGLGGEIVAEGSLPWFRRVRNEGIGRIRPSLAGLRFDKGTDSPWGLLTEGDRGLEIWVPGVGRRFNGHDDLQPLRLTMTSGRFDRWSLKAPLSVDDASDALSFALASAKTFFEESEHTVAASAIGKFQALHTVACPDVAGELSTLASDLDPCALPLFASGARLLTFLETTGLLVTGDEEVRKIVAPLWSATREALESAV